MICIKYHDPGWDVAKAVAVKEQPRQAVNRSNLRTLPHENSRHQAESLLLEKLNLDCRRLIWEYVLQADHTRIERWRPFYDGPNEGYEAFGMEYFPYRVVGMTGHFGKVGASLSPPAKPLALLLSCRQLYSEGLETLYSQMTFVFEKPMDLHCFRLIVSPEGLGRVRSILMAINQFDWLISGTSSSEELLNEGNEAFHDFEKMISLQKLQVWLHHHNYSDFEELDPPPRPWVQKAVGIEAKERKHQKLFDMLGTVQVPNFTVNLTWYPEDIISQRKWPFKINLQTLEKMDRAIWALPLPIQTDLYV